VSESVLVETDAAVALGELEAAMDRFASVSLDPATDDQVEDLLRRFETIRNRTAVVDHRLLQQVVQRSIRFARGCKTTAVYLKFLLRLAPGEAHRRVKAYERFGQRVHGSLVAGPVYRDTAATPPRHRRDTAATPPRHRRGAGRRGDLRAACPGHRGHGGEAARRGCLRP
jgi:hypothetical protein